MCIGTLETRAERTAHDVEAPTRPLSSPSAHAQKRALRAEEMHISPMVVRAIFVKQVDRLDLRVWTQAARARRASESRYE